MSIPSPCLTTPTPTPPLWLRRHYDDNDGHDHRDRRHDDPDKPDNAKPTHANATTTDKDGRTIIVTTVIIASGPDPNKVYHDMGSGARQQQQTPIDDPNKSSEDSSLEAQLREDQAALRRMVTILSLVGGLGVVAIVATIVIFARMRIRKRKQTEQDMEDIQAEDDVDDQDDDDEADDDNNTENTPPRSTNEMADDRTAEQQETGVEHDLQAMPAPSAPPAPALSSIRSQLAVYDGTPHRRHIISMTSQTTPAPSAPTAKELDALGQEDDDLCNHLSTHGYANGSGSNDPLPKPQCPHCDHSPIPEAPPPAYTPSAPPLYAMPVENAVLDSSLSSSSTSSSHLLPQRRHSQS
ncbi:hypothetical protein DFQ28_006020 [Apophysomyces sp. BC1034]|nr:hypothetical protein DFQ30_008311 [Apophysomyces sp. BC1015]KAG0181795.1 hypothetical protein DFQ29_007022 [Apophysomyces sp. BC1021]KAG0193238.1 hypothetical protein DFQ28_006020 [Apophysomyces sp. BC1034]